MKRSVLFLAIIILASCATVKPETYFTMDEMPDLVKCLPAPPAPGTPEFGYDSLRYFWGREQRRDPVRAAIADRDAGWQIDTIIAIFSEPFGMRISPDRTPEIWQLLYGGIKTMEQIRVRPKAYFHRQRPFEYFGDHVLTLWEEDELRGEGSYPSGHTIRGWAMALMLAEINPDAAEAIYAKGWEYGESRVIVGAHWQSDVDNSRAAASIAYAKLQTSKEFRRQIKRAKKEYERMR
ncbi:MAG: phosphatase PAP2 family protein [Bacteroidales bacterium]|nr:phosphatase PAP2 family protein [Bacteroidales bacterium]